MSIDSHYTNLAGARNHARVEGYQKPSANEYDKIVTIQRLSFLVLFAEVVLKALKGVSAEA